MLLFFCSFEVHCFFSLGVFALAASRKPGPLGTNGSTVDINDGTLVRNLSPLPGPTGHQPHHGLTHHRIGPGRQPQVHKGLPALREGSRDPMVRWAQLLLNQHGANPPLQPDGSFDAKTHAAVVSFQRSQSLGADGIIGMDTWARLVVTVTPAQGTARRTAPLQPAVYSSTRSDLENVADWPLTLRFEKVLGRVPSYLSPELAVQFRAMLTPANIGIVVGTLAAWAASHAFGAGEIIDVILLAVGAFFVGMGVFQAGEDIGDCLMTTLHAKEPEDLEKAAHSLAQAIVILGVVAFFTLLGKVAARFGRVGGAGSERAAAGTGTAVEEAAPKASAVEPKAAAARAGAGESAGRGEGSGAASGTVETPPKPSYASNGDWDAPRDWSYTPKQDGRIDPGAVPDTPEIIEAKNAADGRTAPPAPDGWPKLPDDVAKTFGADPQPVHLPEGTTLYRVISADKGAGGSYWSTDPVPSTEGAWRASSAVTDEFNGDGGYVQTTVPPGGANGWSGPTAPQPAAYPNMSLPGGGNQIWVPRETFIPDGPPQPTPWNGGS